MAERVERRGVRAEGEPADEQRLDRYSAIQQSRSTCHYGSNSVSDPVFRRNAIQVEQEDDGVFRIVA